jgi:hypothetical protein
MPSSATAGRVVSGSGDHTTATATSTTSPATAGRVESGSRDYTTATATSPATAGRVESGSHDHTTAPSRVPAGAVSAVPPMHETVDEELGLTDAAPKTPFSIVGHLAKRQADAQGTKLYKGAMQYATVSGTFRVDDQIVQVTPSRAEIVPAVPEMRMPSRWGEILIKPCEVMDANTLFMPNTLYKMGDCYVHITRAPSGAVVADLAPSDAACDQLMAGRRIVHALKFSPVVILRATSWVC